jgi:hypothetical protein
LHHRSTAEIAEIAARKAKMSVHSDVRKADDNPAMLDATVGIIQQCADGPGAIAKFW